MLFFALWPDGGGFDSYEEGFGRLREETEARSEFRQVVDMAFDESRHPTTVLAAFLAIPLQVHIRYSREEILAALDHGTLERKPAHFREGVLHTNIDGRPIDAFFITLRKSEAGYSPTTLYRDYPLSPTLFHWESPSTTSVDSLTRRRYRDGSSTIMLFVRRERNGEFGTEPYTFLGTAHNSSHTGDRSMAITWRLDRPMPADLYADSAVACLISR